MSDTETYWPEPFVDPNFEYGPDMDHDTLYLALGNGFLVCGNLYMCKPPPSSFREGLSKTFKAISDCVKALEADVKGKEDED